MKNFRINKRLAASLVSFTMITTSLLGCTVEEYEDFTYETTEDGTIECSGKIDYESLKEYEVVELTIFDKNEIYIARNHEFHGRNSYSNYYADITNGQRLYASTDDNQNKEIINFGKISDYLLYYDMVKDCYSAEDVEWLLTKIKEDKNLTKDKTLVNNK